MTDKIYIDDDSIPYLSEEMKEKLKSSKKIRFEDDEINEVKDKEDFRRYNLITKDNRLRLLNKSDLDDVAKSHKGPFYERFPRGVYEEELKVKIDDYDRIYPYGFERGPYTAEEIKRENRKFYPPSEPDYNLYYEEKYGASLKEMKMVEARFQRRDNLSYSESYFIIDLIDKDDNFIREIVIDRETPIKEFCEAIFGRGNRYIIDVEFAEEINSTIGALNKWDHIQPVIKKLSKKYDKNVYITFAAFEKGAKHRESVAFHMNTPTKDVFDIVFLFHPYRNYFIFRDIPPLVSAFR